MSEFNRTGDFASNKVIMEEELGYKSEETKLDSVILTKPNGEIMTINAQPGKFVSCAFMEYLGAGDKEFTIEGGRYEVLRDFFGPLWDAPGHDTIDFLRKPGVQVKLIYKE